MKRPILLNHDGGNWNENLYLEDARIKKIAINSSRQPFQYDKPSFVSDSSAIFLQILNEILCNKDENWLPQSCLDSWRVFHFWISRPLKIQRGKSTGYIRKNRCEEAHLNVLIRQLYCFDFIMQPEIFICNFDVCTKTEGRKIFIIFAQFQKWHNGQRKLWRSVYFFF